MEAEKEKVKRCKMHFNEPWKPDDIVELSSFSSYLKERKKITKQRENTENKATESISRGREIDNEVGFRLKLNASRDFAMNL